MAVVLKHYGMVKHGQILYYNKPILQQTLYELEGKEYEMIIKERSKNVTPQAHGYYRSAVIGECRKSEVFGGWSREKIHEFLAKMFLSFEDEELILLKDGTTEKRRIMKVRSTGNLNQKEMFKYCEEVIAYLVTDHNIIVQSPEQYKF